MLYEKYIRLVEEHAELLTKSWIEEVKKNPATHSYKNISDDILDKRVYDVYNRLGEYLQQEDAFVKSTAEHFMRLGRERAAENYNASEVVYALILSRVVLWSYILSSGLMNSILELHQGLEFYQRINNFFDKAIYFVSVGFESASQTGHAHSKQDKFIDKAVGALTNWFIKEPR